MPPRKLSHDAYRVGWICPLVVEQIAARLMLDEEHESLPQLPADHNVYKLGSINNHNVVIAGLHQPGNCPAATVVAQMRMIFPNLRYGLLVGIGGGVPVETDDGTITSGELVVKDAKLRDRLVQQHGLLCFEMAQHQLRWLPGSKEAQRWNWYLQYCLEGQSYRRLQAKL